MARSRNIKPGFYLNEDLAQCSLLARYIFPGLWMLCDRKGRMENRPLRIKAALLPYDNGDVKKLLNELENVGLIDIYEVDGNSYIQVCNFEKHQNPHFREVESLIPDPDPKGKSPRLYSHAMDAKPEALPSESDFERGVSHADSLLPITDTLLLNPESGAGVGNSENSLTAKILDFSPAEPPPPQQFNYSSHKFSMHAEWEPSDGFETLAKIAGYKIGAEYPVDEFMEFRLYWVVRPQQKRTQGEWEHAFIKNLKHIDMKKG